MQPFEQEYIEVSTFGSPNKYYIPGAWHSNNMPCPECGAPLTYRNEQNMTSACASWSCDIWVTDELMAHADPKMLAFWADRYWMKGATPLPPHEYVVPVRGISKMHRDVSMLELGMTLELRKDYNHTFDPHAIAVLHPGGYLVGYLPKDIAARMASPWDWNVEVEKLWPDEKQPTGVRLRLTPDREDESGWHKAQLSNW